MTKFTRFLFVGITSFLTHVLLAQFPQTDSVSLMTNQYNDDAIAFQYNNSFCKALYSSGIAEFQQNHETKVDTINDLIFLAEYLNDGRLLHYNGTSIVLDNRPLPFIGNDYLANGRLNDMSLSNDNRSLALLIDLKTLIIATIQPNGLRVINRINLEYEAIKICLNGYHVYTYTINGNLLDIQLNGKSPKFKIIKSNLYGVMDIYSFGNTLALAQDDGILIMINKRIYTIPIDDGCQLIKMRKGTEIIAYCKDNVIRVYTHR
jgi:hypothetical protein